MMSAVSIVRVGLATGVALLVLVGAVPPGAAQQIEPRAYSNIPVGLNFLVAAYVYSHGDVATDPSGPLQDASLTVHAPALGYVRSFDFLGRSGSVGLV